MSTFARILQTFAIVTFLLILTCFFAVDVSLAEIKITEVYPAPESGSLEWVELFNDSERSADISSYALYDLVGNNIHFSQSLIEPFSYVIATSSGVINNSGETLFLRNDSQEITETLVVPKNLTSQQSYILCNSDWYISEVMTMAGSNENACALESSSISPTLQPSLVPTIANAQADQSSGDDPDINSVYISEALVQPLANNQEWVELFNNSTSVVSLQNWQLDDIENAGARPFVFSSEIPALSLVVISLPQAMFNNSGDEIRLLNEEGVLKDYVMYDESNKDFTLNRQEYISNSVCYSKSTKGIANIPCDAAQVNSQSKENAAASANIPLQNNANNNETPFTDLSQQSKSNLLQKNNAPFPGIPENGIRKPSTIPENGHIYTLEKITPRPAFLPFVYSILALNIGAEILCFLYSVYICKNMYLVWDT